MRSVDKFAARYEIGSGDRVSENFTLGRDGAVSRVIAVRPDGEVGEWSAGVRASRPILAGAFTGDVPSPDPHIALIVERGTVFRVDVRNPSEYEEIDAHGPVVEVLSLLQDGLVLLVSPWSVTAIGARGVEWSTPRLSIDGLRLDEVDGGWLRGVADPADDEPRNFAIELATGRVVGGAGIA